ncbi:hypothetical protein RB195_002992 [Necator americanus]|uniref:Uncharacterized protein n=1 Tax=Necator americanus TaxID=51031 RepID=A0ABR1DLK9_NECAM
MKLLLKIKQDGLGYVKGRHTVAKMRIAARCSSQRVKTDATALRCASLDIQMNHRGLSNGGRTRLEEEILENYIVLLESIHSCWGGE